MTDETKAKITIQFRNRTISIDADEKDAFYVLDTLLGRGITSIASSVASPHPIFPQKSSSEKELKVPERSLLTNFIKSQPNYMFSIDGLVMQFIGKNSSEFGSTEEINFLNALRAKANRIRKEIEEIENGEWVVEQKGHQKVFKFIKGNGGDVKQNEDKQQQLTPESY